MRVSFQRLLVDPDETPRIAASDIEVPAPKEIEPGEPMPKWRTIGLPILILIALVGVIAFMIRSGRGFSPYMLIFPVMLLMGVGGMAFGQKGNGGTSRAQLLEDRKASTRALGMIREKIFDNGLSMHRGLQHAYPDPQMLTSRVRSKLMWNVTPVSANNDGYTALRYGLGDVEMRARLIAPEAPDGEFLDPVGWFGTVRLLKHHSTMSNMPVVVTASRFPVIGFSGDREVALGMVRSMLVQAAVSHGPDNLSIVVLTDEHDSREWGHWMKWLPHTRHPYELDRLGNARMIYTDWSTLEESLKGNPEDPDDPRKVIDFDLNFNPDPEYGTDDYRHTLVVVDSKAHSKLVDSVISPRAAVTWLLIDPPEDALTANEGIVFRCDADRTVWLSEAERPLAKPVKVAKVDQVSLLDALTIARLLARSEVATLADMSLGAKTTERGRDWQALTKIRDPGAFAPLEAWSVINRYGDKRRLRIPIAFLVPSGDRFELDLKQVAEGGMGPHGMLIGATGSGKSEFLRNLVINGCATHSPDLLNWLLVDFKGGSTFTGMEKAPHVTAVITNMEDEAHLVARFRDMLNGEMDRRQRVLRRAKEDYNADVKDQAEYEKLREGGADLPPMPTLIVVIDEWSELLQVHPEFGEDFVRLCRLGRSLGVQILFASQRVDTSGRTDKLDANISYRIGLKTFTAGESRMLLQSDAAYKLPPQPGHGVMSVMGGDLIHFYSGYTGAPYFPPAIVDKPGDAEVSQEGAQADPADSVPVRPFTAAPQPLSTSDVVEFVAPERTAEEIRQASSVYTTMVERVASAEVPPAYRMWLPPLEVVTLDTVDPRLRQWKVPTNNKIATLRVPIGLFDEPLKHAQPQWMFDAEKHTLIYGGPQTGKSTTVKTIAMALAAANTPEQIQMYIIDYAGGGLNLLDHLPHVGAVVSKSDPDGINRILTQMAAFKAAREKLFLENRLTIEQYRQARTDPASPYLAQDPYGDVFVIVDGWDAAVAQGQVLQYRGGGEVEALMVGAANYGLHFIFTTTRTSEMRGITPNVQTTIELHTTEMSQVKASLAKERRADPGHAITTASQLQGLVALPRIDSVADPMSIPDGLNAMVGDVAAAFAQRGAARLKTLPTSLLREDLAAMVADADHSAAADPRRQFRLALGVREDTLGVAYAEMYREPHLLIMGDGQTGKSELIGTVCDSITRRFETKQDAVIVLIDPRRRHLGAVDGKNLFAHIHRQEDIQPTMERLYLEFDLKQREVPPDIDAATRAERSWWSGPEIFIVVDDYHRVANPRDMGKPSPMFPMLPWLENQSLARGFHFILARSSAELYVAENRDPLIKRLLEEKAPTVMLSADKTAGAIGETKFERFAYPGRARYVETAVGRSNRIQVAWSGHQDTSGADFED